MADVYDLFVTSTLILDSFTEEIAKMVDEGGGVWKVIREYLSGFAENESRYKAAFAFAIAVHYDSTVKAPPTESNDEEKVSDNQVPISGNLEDDDGKRE